MKRKERRMIDLSGECLVGPCHEETAHLMCAAHWSAVPFAIRDLIVAAYVPGHGWQDSDETWELFGKACGEATRAHNQPAEGLERPKTKKPKRRPPKKKPKPLADPGPGGPVPKWGFGTRLKLPNGKVGPITAIFADFLSVLLCQVVDITWWKAQESLGGAPSTRDQVFYAIDSETEAGWYLVGENDAERVKG